uniref:Cytochrome P450 n=1 Tax=Oryza sativa subsp. japonica TaxID=39947 RepID=Q7Y098_ORYSJ|nr:putative cytochrome P450 [Oryza sativa Japonica Group]
MEDSPVAVAIPWFALAAATAVLAGAAWLIIRACKADESCCRLPPGSRGLPLLGESLEFFARSPSLELLPFLKQRLERYGPIFRTNIIAQDMIVSLDPELNNLVFQQEERLFQCWYPNSFMRVFGADSIITTFGSSHRHVRNLVLRLFGPENLRRAMLQEMQKTAQASLLSWLDRPSIEVKEEVSSMIIFSIIAKKLISYDSSASNGKLWKQFDAFLQGLLADRICIYTIDHDNQFDHCIYMQGRKNVMRMLRELLDERKKKTAHQLESIDFFDALIDELKQEKPAVSENVALDLLFLLLFASFETTSSGITAILRFLTDNPMALEELTEEHDRILKRKADPNSQITWEEYKSMKFTSHALRLANIAPVVFRKARQDVHIKGYTIPKGSKIMLSPSNIHLNPTVYKDPNEFNPWRWKVCGEIQSNL